MRKREGELSSDGLFVLWAGLALALLWAFLEGRKRRDLAGPGGPLRP